MKFLLAGLGSIGRRHFRNLRALGENDILLYRTHKATLPADELAGFPVETDLHAALAHNPAAVIVANPTALHLDVAIPAAQAGCHLLLEKPIAHTLARVDELMQAVALHGVRALVGFQFRHHPGLRKIKGLVESGGIGRPLSVRVHWGEYLPDWHPWEDYRQSYAARADLGGGAIRTLCHPLDYLLMLLGEVESVWCFAGREGLGLEVEDTAEIGLRFAGGAVGSVHLDFVQRPPKHTLELVGTAGTLTWDNADGAARLYRTPAGTREIFSPPEGFERNMLFLDEMRNFLAVARGEEAPACDLHDGVQALRLALAALESAETGCCIAL